MAIEKPLVTWKSIANHLDVCVRTAQKEIKEKKVPVFHIGRMVAIFPSELKLYLEGKTGEKKTCIY